jgi:CheY-like chemotaxis protein
MALVLAVDDAPDILSLLELQLGDSGYTVVTAANGREALELVRSQHPDLVVLDVAMPVMDGLEMLEHLRADPQTQGLPVIALSGRFDPPTVARLGALGVLACIRKPHSTRELRDRIREALTSA